MRFWRRRRRVFEDVISALRAELHKSRAEGERLRLELALVRQAKDGAEQRETYWRTRAETFIDQVGLRSGLLVASAMEPRPVPGGDQFTSVFTALGHGEINRDTPSGARAATAAPALTGVNAAAGQAAVDDALASIGA